MSTAEKPDAVKKLEELLHCGNERVELSAAKELLSLKEESQDAKESDAPFTVEIRVIERTDANG
ncbi:MAG: hypothetical protein IKW60_01090 [Clostridia bacterium]|nr:hypothetical protein [Clostridia bacterium]